MAGSTGPDALAQRTIDRRRVLGGLVRLTGGLALSGLLPACTGRSDSPVAVGAPVATTGNATRPASVSPAAPGTPFANAAVDLVRFLWWQDVGNLTPFQVTTTGPGGVALLTMVFDTLTWKDENGIIPWLGTSWEVTPDGARYQIHVVENAVWHDGSPLTADDVVFSYTYYAQHPYTWMSSDVVESASVEPDGTVSFTLARPAANFLEEIAGIVPIIPRHVWEPVSDPIKYSDANATIGSGPFVMTEHDATSGAYRLTGFTQYWRGTPTALELRQITAPAQSQLQMVRKGDADLAMSTDASIETLLAGEANLKVEVTPPLSIVRLAVNTVQPPLDRKEVRQAIMYALDRATIAKTITKGEPIIDGVGVVPPDTPWYNPAIAHYPFDPAKAKVLLGGQALAIDLLADPSAREPELMAPMLAAVGITLNVKKVDTATRLQLLSEGSFALALTSHIGIGGDPDYLRRWYAGEEANAFAKGSIFKNPQYTELGQAEVATLDPDKRRAIVFQMQQILADELPTIVLYHRRFYWVYRPDVFTPMESWGGLMNGIPLPQNKLTLIRS